MNETKKKLRTTMFLQYKYLNILFIKKKLVKFIRENILTKRFLSDFSHKEYKKESF